VGCGIGGTPAVLARAVGPSGQVVGLELLQDAVEVARLDVGLPPTVSFECGDAQSYPFDPGSFDAVFSRFGTMFFADPRAAFGNLKKALRPGGRLAFVCWRSLAENELDELPLRAAAPHLPRGLESETAGAAWFSFSDPDYLRMILGEAGFQRTEVDPRDEIVRSGSLQAMVEVCTRVGALGAILREHPDLRPSTTAALQRALSERDGPGGPALRAATWVVSAHVRT
jgi:SAM-dependent methyltransferase